MIQIWELTLKNERIQWGIRILTSWKEIQMLTLSREEENEESAKVGWRQHFSRGVRALRVRRVWCSPVAAGLWGHSITYRLLKPACNPVRSSFIGSSSPRCWIVFPTMALMTTRCNWSSGEKFNPRSRWKATACDVQSGYCTILGPCECLWERCLPTHFWNGAVPWARRSCSQGGLLRAKLEKVRNRLFFL